MNTLWPLCTRNATPKVGSIVTAAVCYTAYGHICEYLAKCKLKRGYHHSIIGYYYTLFLF